MCGKSNFPSLHRMVIFPRLHTLALITVSQNLGKISHGIKSLGLTLRHQSLTFSYTVSLERGFFFTLVLAPYFANSKENSVEESVICGSSNYKNVAWIT